jgi:tetratricopeptide (TPR) repeat protein
MKYLSAAIDLMPNDPDVLYFAGELLIRSSRWSDARSFWERLAAIKPQDFAAWFYIGLCYSQEKNYKKAIEIYEEKAMPLQPKNTDLLTNLAYAYRENGNNKKALEYLQKVEQIQKEKED